MQKVIGYVDKNYKKLLLIPIILFLAAIIQIGIQTATTGDFVNKGISLKGGSVISITQPADAVEVQSLLRQQFPNAQITVRSITDGRNMIGIAVESAAQEDAQIATIISAIQTTVPHAQEDRTVEVTGSALGDSFFKQTFIAMMLAFVLMAVVVFIYFRTFIPSVAVVLAALSDIIITVAVFNLTGMRLSTSGIAAFLMLIGYSVDTDILLTTRMLKRKTGTIMERFASAMKTGLTMSITTIGAVITALFITNSPVVQQIMIILLIGLIVDLINTWIQNAGIIRLYMEKKHEHQ